MYSNKRENIIIATSALLFAVGFTHLLRIIFGVEVVAGGESIAMWVSYLAVLVTGTLVVLNLKTLERGGSMVWTKFIAFLLAIDAIFVFYSWVSGLSYWGISHNLFGVILVVEIIVIILLYFKIRRSPF